MVISIINKPWQAYKAYKKAKKVSKTITSVPPNVPKTSTQKIKRDLNLLKHEMSGKMKKMSQDVFHLTDDFKKGVRKFKKKD